MALATYFLVFTLIIQANNVALCAEEGFHDVITQLGLGNLPTVRTTQTYINNVDSLLSTFVSESSRGFFNTSAGEGSDRAYGMYLCRGDLSPEDCNGCLDLVRQKFTGVTKFMYYADGLVYHMQLNCMVHYANSSAALIYRENDTTGFNTRGFGDKLAPNSLYSTTLLRSLQEMAIRARDGNWTSTNFETRLVAVAEMRIYILAQCTSDLSPANCYNCLNDLYTTFRPSTIGGNALGTNCLIKYNDEPLSGSGSRNMIPSSFLVVLALLWATYVMFM